MRVRVRSRPPSRVKALHAPLQHTEHHFHVRRAPVHNRERVKAKCRGHLPVHVPGRTRRANHHNRRRRRQPIQQIQNSTPRLIRRRPVIQGQPQIDHRDMDRRRPNHPLRIPSRSRLQRSNAHRLQQVGHAIRPGVRPPSAPRKQEVQPRPVRGHPDPHITRNPRTVRPRTTPWAGVISDMR